MFASQKFGKGVRIRITYEYVGLYSRNKQKSHKMAIYPSKQIYAVDSMHDLQFSNSDHPSGVYNYMFLNNGMVLHPPILLSLPHWAMQKLSFVFDLMQDFYILELDIHQLSIPSSPWILRSRKAGLGQHVVAYRNHVVYLSYPCHIQQVMLPREGLSVVLMFVVMIVEPIQGYAGHHQTIPRLCHYLLQYYYHQDVCGYYRCFPANPLISCHLYHS